MKTGKTSIPTWLGKAGSLTTLGSVGGSLGYLAYSRYPELEQAGLTPEHVVAVGGAIGTAVHFIGLPILRYIFDYVQLGELLVLKWIKALPTAETDRLRRDIIRRHFQPADPLSHAVRARSEETAKHAGQRSPNRSDAFAKPSSVVAPSTGSRVLARRAVKGLRSKPRIRTTSPKLRAHGQKKRRPHHASAPESTG